MRASEIHRTPRKKWLTKLIGVCLPLLAAQAWGYDLTPDRGQIAISLSAGSSRSFIFHVFNVGRDNWGPVNNCGTNWADAQWRGEDGKQIGSTLSKPVIYQTDFYQITNGWFTPNAAVGYLGCSGSHISRGWDDEYTNPGPEETWPSPSVKPTFHVRLDPAVLNSGDENLNNNEVWITTQWSSTSNFFVPLENIDIPQGSTTLGAADSIFYGAYSTNNANGTITITNKNRSNTLVDGNEKLGYQGRRMKVVCTGGAKNSYTIKNRSKVTAEFLGQNVY